MFHASAIHRRSSVPCSCGILQVWGDIPPEQLPGNLRRYGSLGGPPKDQADNFSHILVNLHTSIRAFPVPIGANLALVLMPRAFFAYLAVFVLTDISRL